MNTETNEQYWQGREFEITPIRKVINFIKKNKVLNNITTFFYSNRIGDEKFIKYAFAKVNHSTVLDIACGAGKDIIALNSDYLIGVDITGYPKQTAIKRGYDELVEYNGPDYKFEISRKVDLITCINLNAHIPFEYFASIFKNALLKLNTNGKIILLNELDNNAPSYKHFSKNQQLKKRLVLGMEHYHFETEHSFLNKFKKVFPEIQIVERKPIVSIVTLAQNYAYRTQKDPNYIIDKLLFFADAISGFANSIYIKYKGDSAEGFLVGYIMEIKK